MPAGKLEWVLARSASRCCACSSPSFSRHGLFKGDRVMGVLRDLMGNCAIEDLHCRLHGGGDQLERQGGLATPASLNAIRASMSANSPAIFTPSRLGGRRLVDGALRAMRTIAPTLNDPTDLTIAVNLGGAEVLGGAAAARPPAPPAANGKGNDYRNASAPSSRAWAARPPSPSRRRGCSTPPSTRCR